MDRPRRDAVAGLRRRAGSGSSGRRKPQSTTAAQGIVRRIPVNRSSTSASPGRTPRSSVRRSMRTPTRANRALAGARSPVRESSLPAMWSWVTRTARAPSSSARATPIGPPIGIEHDDVAFGGEIDLPPTQLGHVDHHRVVADLVLPRSPATEPVHWITASAPAGTSDGLEPHVDTEPGNLARQPRDERLVRPGDRGQAAQPRRPLDERHRVPA